MDNSEASKKRARAANMGVLRAVVAAYLVYLGGSLIRDWLQGGSTLAPWMVWLCGLFFIAAGLGFGLYTWRRWKADAKAAAEETGAAASESENEEDVR